MVSIAVIEPSEPDARWLRIVLEELGIPYVLQPFESPNEAAEGLRRARRQPDLLLLNWRLPALSASETMQLVRSVRGLEQLPLAVMILDEHEAAETPGADWYLTKPIDAGQMRPLLEFVQKNRKRAASVRGRRETFGLRGNGLSLEERARLVLQDARVLLAEAEAQAAVHRRVRARLRVQISELLSVRLA